MAIDLSSNEVPSQTLKTGDDSFELAAGKSLKVETIPNGSELLNETVPEGKKWQVVVYVSIVETAA